MGNPYSIISICKFKALYHIHTCGSYIASLQESEEEVTDTEQAENWFSLTSAQRICGKLFIFFASLLVKFSFFSSFCYGVNLICFC